MTDQASLHLYYYYVGYFLFALVALLAARQFQSSASNESRMVVTTDFKRFQRSYVLVFLLMMGADWLQGPYVYALYSHYGYSISQIGQLFILGFGSSLLFGTVAGSIADKYGRKKMCLAFAVMYSISCLTKHVNDIRWLALGRVLGGISTSILFSAFEAWMVHEHHDAAFPDTWLGMTFSICTTGNGIVAIVAGIVAGVARDHFGPVAPFDASMICLIIGFLLISSTWRENYGDQTTSMQSTFSHAWTRLKEDNKVALLGLIQSFFEGAMYVFVFMWTPALESTSSFEIFHGWVFASFMVCVLIGSQLFKYFLDKKYPVEKVAMNMFGVACLSLLVPALTQSHSVRLFSFSVFEVCCGIFWPCMGTMRGRYLPEEVRATVMNFFRIPLNLIVVVVLWNISSLSENQVFFTCVLCLIPSFLCQMKLVSLTIDSEENATKKDINTGDNVELEELVPAHGEDSAA